MAQMITTTPRHGHTMALRLMAVVLVMIAAALAAVGAHAQGGHGHGPAGFGMLFSGSADHISRATDRLLDGLDATDAQRAQIKQIAAAAATDLKAQRDGARALQQQGLQIFTAPTVDARAAETLRQQMSAQHDQASKRVLQAALDISQVLTPAQRAQIGARITQRETALQGGLANWPQQ